MIAQYKQLVFPKSSCHPPSGLLKTIGSDTFTEHLGVTFSPAIDNRYTVIADKAKCYPATLGLDIDVGLAQQSALVGLNPNAFFSVQQGIDGFRVVHSRIGVSYSH